MIEAIYLYVILQRGDGSASRDRYAHPTYASCFAALKQMKVTVSPGAENEVAVVAYCAAGKELQRYSDGSWRAEP